MVACSQSHMSSSQDKSHHGLFRNTRQRFWLTFVCTAGSQSPPAFLTRLPMYSPKMESSKIDGCKHPFSISIRKQDDTPTLMKCRIAASQMSALTSVLSVHNWMLCSTPVLFRSSASWLAKSELPCSPWSSAVCPETFERWPVVLPDPWFQS